MDANGRATEWTSPKCKSHQHNHKTPVGGLCGARMASAEEDQEQKALASEPEQRTLASNQRAVDDDDGDNASATDDDDEIFRGVFPTASSRHRKRQRRNHEQLSTSHLYGSTHHPPPPPPAAANEEALMAQMGLPTRIRNGTAEANNDNYSVLSVDPARALGELTPVSYSTAPDANATTSSVGGPADVSDPDR